MTWWRKLARQALAVSLSILLGFGVVGCGGRSEPSLGGDRPEQRPKAVAGRLSEVAPPEAIQELRQTLERYQPQVSILSPRNDETFQENQVAVRFQVRDLPIYKDERFELGPHLHVILDNQPYQAVYDIDSPLVLSDLEPGTHTLRVFASRPWHESFKNEGAYTQVTFHVFTPSPNNHPADEQPLLTYSRPKGSYGAEPIMLDFYLKNAPLHFVAQEDPADNIPDWKIRCTINGESFTFDTWQPIYLKGFKPGQNWLKLELLDDKGNLIDNAFNSTVRLITYEPNGQDTLSRIVRGELSAAAVRSIVDPNAVPEAVEIVPEPEPEPSPTPVELPSPEPLIPIPVEPTPAPAPEAPTVTPPTLELEPEPTEVPAGEESTEQEAPTAPESDEPVTPAEPQPAEQKPGGFFNRFRRTSKPDVAPAPLPPTLPEVIEEPDLESVKEEIQTEESPEASTTDETFEPEVTPAPSEQKPQGLFERFRKFRPAPETPATPEPPPTLPEIIEAPLPELDESGESEIELAPAPDTDETPLEFTPAEPETPQPTAPAGGLFDRFFPRRLPTAPAAVPEENAPEPEIPGEFIPTPAEPEQTPESSVLTPSNEETSEESNPNPSVETPATSSKPVNDQTPSNPFQRFFPRRSTVNESSPEPSPGLDLNGSDAEALPDTEAIEESPLEEPVEAETPEATEPSPTKPAPQPNPNPLGSFLKRFQSGSPSKPGPEFTPTPLPDTLESPEAESVDAAPVPSEETLPTPAIPAPAQPENQFSPNRFQPKPPVKAPEASIEAPESSSEPEAAPTIDTEIDAEEADSLTAAPEEPATEPTSPSPADILQKYRSANNR